MRVGWAGCGRTVVLVAVAMGVLSAPAMAAPASCTGAGNGAFAAGTLNASCVIGDHITAVHIVAIGAPGGTVIAQSPGGHGANVTADYAVAAGTTLFVNVGGAGTDPGTTGGANGGGPGGSTTGGSTGASGGGASDVRTPTNNLSDRFLVAGGGGGGGFSTSSPSAFPGADADGGTGGFFIGGSSANSGTPGNGGGVDGANPGQACSGSTGGATTNGLGGTGFGLGAGGGGGYAGGGGGGEIFTGGTHCDDSFGGGGGGGSSLLPAAGLNVTKTTDTTGVPSVTITAPVPATSTGPTISGQTRVGQTLTESHAPWSGAPSAYTIQWLRCDTSGTACLPIGSGASTYTLTNDDLGHTIEVQETAANFYGSSLAAGAAGTATSSPSTVVGTPPALTSPPAISGTPVLGHTLTEVNANWSQPPITARAYQWRRCDTAGANCQPISGATGQTYVLSAADLGATLDVQETASNSFGQSAPAPSGNTGVVGAPPVAGSPPAISGSATQGQMLTEAHGTWSNPPLTAFSYQWQRCAAGGGRCTPISGATNQTYTLTAADVGSRITVQEVAANAYGAGVGATSGSTAVVAPSARPTASIGGAGTVLVGQAARFQASVVDSLGVPSTYRWTIAGRSVGTRPTLSFTFSRPGKVTITLQVVDTSGNTMRSTHVVTVKAQQLGISLPWLATSFPAPPVSVFGSLDARGVPAGTHIVLRCTGSGCPFTSRSLLVRAVKGKPRQRRNVSLLGLLHHARLAAGARLVIRFEKRFWIATIYTFRIGKHAPVRTQACQAPGAAKPTPC